MGFTLRNKLIYIQELISVFIFTTINNKNTIKIYTKLIFEECENCFAFGTDVKIIVIKCCKMMSSLTQLQPAVGFWGQLLFLPLLRSV